MQPVCCIGWSLTYMFSAVKLWKYFVYRRKPMAKAFIENFTDARRVSTPFVAVRTPDPMSTVRNVVKSLDDRAQADKRNAPSSTQKEK